MHAPAVTERVDVGAHPRQVLLGAQAAAHALPVCDHYSGVEVRMRKSLQLQAEMTQEFGTCVFDVSLDCEDGAPVGGEADHAELVTELALAAAPDARVAVRVHPVDHPAFEADVATIAGRAGHRLCHLMVPKVESVADVERVERALNDAGATALPVHVLIESPAAVHRAFEIAAHPRVQSLSFGLMDFVSAHGGAIPAAGMSSAGQFTHPLVCVPNSISPVPVMRTAKCPRTAWSPSSTTPRPCALRRVVRRKSWAIPACGASTRRKSVRFLRPWPRRPTKCKRPVTSSWLRRLPIGRAKRSKHKKKEER